MKRRSIGIFVLLGIIIFVGLGFFYFLEPKNIHNLIFTYPHLSKIEFAGEKVPFDKKHFYNKERFDKEYIITSNTLYQFFLYVKRYPNYIPYIESRLKKYKIPNDFKYLAIAESALRLDVKSSAGANGIWQFMPDTGRKYNLIINDSIDERNNFEKSTEAAMKHFLYLHKQYKNWTLVATAYNRGENGLKRDLESQKVNNYYDLYLNEETSRYVFRILAIKYLLNDYFSKKSVIDFFIGDAYGVPNTEVVKVGKVDDLLKWSQDKGQSYNTIKLLNPWILGNTLPDGSWEVKILQ